MQAPWYVTRQMVKAATDVDETALVDAQVDRACESASRAVEGHLHRQFWPRVGTLVWDESYVRERYAPALEHGRGDAPWWGESELARPARVEPVDLRLWMDGREDLIALTGLSAVLASGAATALSAASVLLRPATGPPYRYLELKPDATARWEGTITATGTFGHLVDEAPAGTLSGGITDSVTTVAASDGRIGVGALLRVDAERVIVTDVALADTTATLAAGLDADTAATAVTVAGSGGFVAGEVIAVGAERMLVTTVAGATLAVRRAVDGSTLAAHSASAAVFAPRSLTVLRGACGTTAAAHAGGAAVARQRYPGPVEALALAYALDEVGNQSAGYSITGGGNRIIERQGLVDVAEKRAFAAYGRIGGV